MTDLVCIYIYVQWALIIVIIMITRIRILLNLNRRYHRLLLPMLVGRLAVWIVGSLVFIRSLIRLKIIKIILVVFLVVFGRRLVLRNDFWLLLLLKRIGENDRAVLAGVA